MQLADELRLYGCECDPLEFHDILVELLHAMHPDWNQEQLLYHPTDGLGYVRAVRCRARCDGLPEEVILRRLNNIRKNGR
jgi:hypothetical protein